MERFSQSPTEPAFVQNPYPFYDRTRAQGPLFYWEDYDLSCLTGFAEVDAALRDRRLGRAIPAEFARPAPEHIRPFTEFESHSILELEAPDHGRIRRLLTRAFTARAIAAMGDGIKTLSHELIDAFPAGPFDLLAAYGERIPVIVISRMLGVPEDMAGQLLAWSHAMVAMYQAGRSRETEDAAVRATLDFSDFMRAHIETRRKNPGNDIISTLIAAGEDGAQLSSEEVITTAILLLNAGHEATVHAIGNGARTLLTMPTGRQDALTPDNADATIQECLRFDPPLHMFTRHVYERMELAGHVFERGDEIGLLLGAANRDPARFEDANRFDPGRADAANISFGAGVHFCIGAPLARLEMKIALGTLWARCPKLRMVGQPRYGDRYHFHGLGRLMVTCPG